MSYNITYSLTNMTVTGPSTFDTTATGTLIAGSGYRLPTKITVSGCDCEYDDISGEFELSNPTGNVTITAVALTNEERLKADLNEMSDYENEQLGTSIKRSVPKIKRDMKELSGATGNQDIETLSEYDVRDKATARISATERAKIIPQNIAQNVTILGVTGSCAGGIPNGYNVTFMSDGSAYEFISVLQGDSIPAPLADPTKQDYTFKGWGTSDAATSYISFPYTPSGNITLYAVLKPDITVTFMNDGVVYDTETVHDGQSVSAPTEPTKQGYTFEGWAQTSGGSDYVTFPYTPTQNTTLYAAWQEAVVGVKASVSGLGNSDPTSQVYTRDENFPTSFEEVTFNGDVFVKIPTMYRKVVTVTDGQITAFEMATAKLDNDYEPYPVFVAPDNSILPYVLIGKYLSTSDQTLVSVSGTPVSTLTIGTGRTLAAARGTGYQQYDVHFQKLFVDLCLLISQRVNFESGVEIQNYIGVDHLQYGFWVDGIAADNNQWLVAYNPAHYVDSPTTSSTGYSALSYAEPTTSEYIKSLGYDSNHGFINYPSSTSGASASTYYCDYMYYASGSHPVLCSVGNAFAYLGLWSVHADFDWSYGIRSRLCYRPLSA